MARAGLRIAVVGATGALGSELLACLDASRLEVGELVPVATDRSLGRDIEFHGEARPVETELGSLRDLDLVFLCAPPSASLDYAREALRHQLPAIDLSGALAGNDDVPLRVAAFGPPEPDGSQPLVAAPPAGSLAWALVLRPLAERAGLVRATGTALEAASVGGRGGIESLYAESLAIFAQDDPPEPGVFPRPVAFDCLPVVGAPGEDGVSEGERALLRGLERLFGPDVRFAATLLQVPSFVGYGVALSVETADALEPKEAADLLARAPGVKLAAEPPTLRASAGRDVVLVGRVRRDPSCERGLLLWLSADLLRLAAANGVGIAEARFSAR